MVCNTNLSLFSQNSECFLDVSANIIDYFTKPFCCYTIIGGFNMEPINSILKDFSDSNSFCNLVKRQAGFKGKGSLTDLILKTRKSFL